MSVDDDVNVDRARQGDRDAFAALVRKYQKRVYATAFHITGNHGDADDVAQVAFMRAYRGLSRFDGRADFFTWLYRIVVNVALNQVRARKRTAAEPLDPGGLTERTRPAPGADPARQTEARAEARRVLEALALLAPALRVTLVLAAIEQMSYKEISLAMACPEGTVAWRVNQARKLLRQRLADLSPAEEIDTDELLRRAKHAAAAP